MATGKKKLVKKEKYRPQLGMLYSRGKKWLWVASYSTEKGEERNAHRRVVVVSSEGLDDDLEFNSNSNINSMCESWLIHMGWASFHNGGYGPCPEEK